MAVIDFSHGGDIYAVKEKYGKNVLDFSASINPLGLSSAVTKAICRGFNKILHYPDSQNRKITHSLSRYWGIKEDDILVGNGSIELIYMITQAFRPKTAAIVVPSFSEYERACRLTGSRIRFVTLKEKDGFMLKENKFGRPDILFLCNPNNPTGNLLLPDSSCIKNLSAKLIFVDESFMDFLKDEDKYSLLRKTAQCKNLIVLRTFTKFFALAGLRIGYVVAHKNLIQILKRYRIPWQVNALAQESGCSALADKSYQKRTRYFIEQERKFLLKKIAGIKGLKPYSSAANFILMRIDKAGLTSGLLRERLIRKGILIRDCANFRGLDKRYFRVAVRTRKENLRLLAALEEEL